MGILKKAWINELDLSEEEKNNFKRHYEEKENIYILTSNGNIEYKIIDYKNNIYYLEFTGKVII